MEYIETHEEEIRTGYNSFLKETTQSQKKIKTASSTDSDISEGVRTTRRHRTKQTPSSLNKLQVYSTPIVLEFN